MSAKINGIEENIEGISIIQLIENRKIEKNSLIVEYNYEVLKNEKWESTIIKDNDNIELLSFVGGG